MNSRYLDKILISVLLIISLSLFLNFENVIIYSQNNSFRLSDYEFHSYIEQIIAHLEASIENKQFNNIVMAIQHSLHPFENILEKINDRLFQTNATLANDVSNRLEDYVASIGSNSLSDSTIEKNNIEEILNVVLNQTIPIEQRTNDKYILNVTAELINAAQEEYADSIYEGKIIDLVKYQDSQQFFKRAINLLENFSNLTESEKQILFNIKKLKHDIDSKNETSGINIVVNDLLCEIKGGFYC